MAVIIASRAEPLPGYKLIERIGGGGFGEVWKAEAPGGLYKAIKFVFGNIEASGEEGSRAEQELKALKRVKEVRHPYILSIERYDIIDGRLMIVMELADRTLWDRFRECRMEGMQGIPRKELLSYLSETAEALDLMNSKFGLQHLDIKPQNLFLVYDHVKVADFGLIKDLQGAVATVTGGVTPVYAAPETFDGKVSRSTDQYSLAIVYQELLTGKRPFAGTTARQLVLQHLQSEPDLSPLPPAEWPIMQKALSKNYTNRYNSCLEFIQELRSVQVASKLDAPGDTHSTPPCDTPHSAAIDYTSSSGRFVPAGSEFTTKGCVKRPKNGVKKQSEAEAATNLPVDFDAGKKRPGANGVHDRQQQHLPNEPAASSKLSLGLGTLPEHDSQFDSANSSQKCKSPKISADGVLLPALVIGLGETGQTILKQMRRQIQESFGGMDPLPNVRFMLIDTDAKAVQAAATGGDQSLRQPEIIHTRLQRASSYLKRTSLAANVNEWLPKNTLYRISRQPEAAGLRSLGRLAFVDNYRAIHSRLQAEIRNCLNGDALKTASTNTGLGIASAVPRVYIVTNLAGGTGSGMLVDLAYLVQDLLARCGVRETEVVGYCLCPLPSAVAKNERGLANACAALKELDYFASAQSEFHASYPDLESPNKIQKFSRGGPPLDRCNIIPIESQKKTENGKLAASGCSPGDVQTANLLFTELCTGVGRNGDRFHKRWREAAQAVETPSSIVYQIAGANRIIYPRQHLAGRVARRLCLQLVEKWMSKDAFDRKEIVQKSVARHWTEMQLSSDELILHFQSKCKKALGESVDGQLRKIVEPLLPIEKPEGPKPNNSSGQSGAAGQFSLAPAVAALQQLEELLGIPDGCQSIQGPITASAHPTGTVSEVLRKSLSKLTNNIEKNIAEMVVRLIEQPEFRLAGAEETLRQFTAIIQDSLTHQEVLVQELCQHSVASYNRILALLEQADKAPGAQPPSWSFSLTRRNTPAKQQLSQELVELLKQYPKCFFQSQVLQHVNSFFVALRGLLSDQLREVDFCRDRLRELAANFDDIPKGGNGCAGSVFWQRHLGQVLLPGGFNTIDEAVQNSVETVSADGLLQLDAQIEKVIRRQFKALVHICLGSGNILRNLAPVMETAALQFLNGFSEDNDVIQMYLDLQLNDETPDDIVQSNLMDAYEEAAPGFSGTTEMQELCILAMPDSPNRQKLTDLIRNSLNGRQMAFADSVDEILLYRERLFTSPGELKQLGKQVKTAYEHHVNNEQTAPHSRYDISDWTAPR